MDIHFARQYRTWLVCQFCGRVTARSESDGWLNEPHRHNRNLNIVRCPQHWSEWALRHTVAGRTTEMRNRMRAALAMPAPPIPPHVSPFPLTERKEE